MNYQFDLYPLEFQMIRDLIHEISGIYFKEEKINYVKMKLYPRVISQGFNSFLEYIRFLKYHAQAERERMKMISLLTNNESYFFREAPQLEVFQIFVLPKLRAMKVAAQDKNINILSAGCSTGEELYTLSILLYETGGFFWDWKVNLVGMDIDEQALETARQGFYYQRSFRMTDPWYLNKFFSQNSGDYLVKDAIKKNTKFLLGNITDSRTWETLHNLDVILCRNVLIYFSEEKVKLALDHFQKALNPEGYLLLGHSETISEINNNFEVIRLPEAIIYQKRKQGTDDLISQGQDKEGTNNEGMP